MEEVYTLRRLGDSGDPDKKGMPYVNIYNSNPYGREMFLVEDIISLYKNKDGSSLTSGQIKDMKPLDEIEVIKIR